MNINSYHGLITFIEPQSWEQQAHNKRKEEPPRDQQLWKNLVSHSQGCQIKLTCARQYWYTVTLGASEAKLLSPNIFSCKHLSVRMASMSSEADIETDWTIGRHQTEAWGPTSRNRGRKKILICNTMQLSWNPIIFTSHVSAAWLWMDLKRNG